MNALGLIEIKGWSPTIVALDAMTKAADVTLLQVELNDLYGACIKVSGETADVQAAVEAGRAAAEAMHVDCVARVIAGPDRAARAAYDAKPEFSPLIEQDVVHIPRSIPSAGASGTMTGGTTKQSSTTEPRVSEQAAPFAIGMIETQGLTAVIEAIDTACKAGNVEILGREKLGGGYVTVLLKGDVAAVKAAIAAGREKVESAGLGKLIAAHVIPRPSAQVLALLPK